MQKSFQFRAGSIDTRVSGTFGFLKFCLMQVVILDLYVPNMQNFPSLDMIWAIMQLKTFQTLKSLDLMDLKI